MDKLLQSKQAMKIISFLIAFMLWMGVAMDQETDTNFAQEDQVTIDHVDVEVLYDEELYSIVEMEEDVQVLLSGRRSLLNATVIGQENFNVYADLRDLGSGEHYVELEHEGFPSELDVQLVPSQIRVVLEENEARPFPVEIETLGDVPEGYTFEAPVFEETEAYVIGPESLVDEVDNVRGYMTIDQADESIEEEVELRAYDEEENEVEVEISPQTIEATVVVIPPSDIVPFQLQLENELPEGLSLVHAESQEEEIEVFAPLDVLEELSVIEYVLDLSEIEQSQTMMVEVPVENQWHGVNPSTVAIDITVDSTQEQLFTDLPIAVEGLAEDLELAFVDPVTGEIALTLLGSEEQLEGVTEDDIDVILDAQDLDEGEHEVELEIGIPDYLQYAPQEIVVEVEVLPEVEAVEANGEGNTDENNQSDAEENEDPHDAGENNENEEETDTNQEEDE